MLFASIEPTIVVESRVSIADRLDHVAIRFWELSSMRPCRNSSRPA